MLEEKMARTFKPLGRRILVREVPSPDRSISGIILPDGTKQDNREGVIQEIGEAVLSVEAGDCILFGKWVGSEIYIQDKKYILIQEQDVFGIFKNVEIPVTNDLACDPA